MLGAFPHLTEDDVRSTPMGVTGPDVQLSKAAKAAFPFSPEVKMQESLNIWEAIRQAESNSSNLTPLVVFGRNRQTIWAALPLVALMSLISGTLNGSPGTTSESA